MPKSTPLDAAICRLHHHGITELIDHSQHINSHQQAFICLTPQHDAALKHCQQAYQQGSRVLLCDTNMPSQHTPFKHIIPIDSISTVIIPLATQFYNDPCQSLHIVAITGTNGKTSCAYWLTYLINQLIAPCYFIGTLGAGQYLQLQATGLTTPSHITLLHHMAQAVQQGCCWVVMEASSHALDQGRCDHIPIKHAILTQITQDHLDYHPSLHHYVQSKKRLFEKKGLASITLNLDDLHGAQWAKEYSNHHSMTSYSASGLPEASIRASSIHCHINQLTFNIHEDTEQYCINAPTLGKYQVDNLLALYALLRQLAVPGKAISQAMRSLPSIPGRATLLHLPNKPVVVIDFAHTTDALQQILQTLQQHCQGAIITVFGCGGERDKSKRPQMLQIAQQLSHYCIITADNPRHEPIKHIINDMLAGAQYPNVMIETDRKQAIIQALTLAKPSDWVLIAGKGHETYQVVGDHHYPFDDRQVALDCLNTLA